MMQASRVCSTHCSEQEFPNQRTPKHKCLPRMGDLLVPTADTVRGEAIK